MDGDVHQVVSECVILTGIPVEGQGKTGYGAVKDIFAGLGKKGVPHGGKRQVG